MNSEELLNKSEQAPDEMLLHIIPQETFHSPVTIKGSKSALHRLGTALINASEKDTGSVDTIMMSPVNGEYYNIELEPASHEQLWNGPEPYAQLWHPWDLKKEEKPSFDWLMTILLLVAGTVIGSFLMNYLLF